MEEFAEDLLTRLEELDILVHEARDDLRGRLRVMRSLRDPAFRDRLHEAEKIMEAGDHRPDPPELLEQRLAKVRG